MKRLSDPTENWQSKGCGRRSRPGLPWLRWITLRGSRATGPVILMGCSTGLKEPVTAMETKATCADLETLRATLKRDYGFEL